MRAARRICLNFFGIVGQGGREPGAGEGPFAVGGGPGQAQRGGRLLDRQAGKHPRFDDLGGHRLLGGQPFQGVVQLQEPLIGGGGGRLEALEGKARRQLLAPRRFDEDAAHGLGGGRHFLAAVGKVLIPDQPQVRLMDEGRCLQRLPRLFAGQLCRRQPAQLVVDKRQQLRGGVRVAPLDSGQDAGHVAHRQSCKARRSRAILSPSRSGWAVEWGLSAGF
jgi:hypothetical protein